MNCEDRESRDGERCPGTSSRRSAFYAPVVGPRLTTRLVAFVLAVAAAAVVDLWVSSALASVLGVVVLLVGLAALRSRAERLQSRVGIRTRHGVAGMPGILSPSVLETFDAESEVREGISRD